MNIIDEILAHNRAFIENKEYEKYQTTKFPDKRLVVLSCMDTRLEELLPKAMNLRNGDFKHVKSAGAVVSHPFGSIMRSILVAIYELNAEEVVVVGHYDCGMSVINADNMMAKMKARGITEETFNIIKHSGFRLHSWLRGFDHVEDSVKQSVEVIKNHPLLPKEVPVHGLLIDPVTGRLDRVVDGYELATPVK
ncbi:MULTISPECIES: beta-class carbonic anhydrase [Brevibacillus]|uniref:carbonic anhydrase n=1 Tax=Brevibacillus borstelensis AK1 TaxID=1300222 RepID=M8DJU4_9BACL|nr:carbonic anhydrase [Brevibacillus borstelensis]EMT53717.1 carbonic anhydrase [Brevibacillus borstelensis AK1]KKX56869.1 carbonic anhydrase [Brevibacillus borstelensis cifa_chp40]MBE5394631.1 carbonic anhydrase [Brevibacillus borstelensis]MCC0562611.1 carbonic anhydrase [Brevibacillus borstelensis]MCM3469781.1 carbonic anhydrase [Brevibacillus borstelensis]